MKLAVRLLFIFICLFFYSNTLHAQKNLFDLQDMSEVRVEDLSDSQLMSFYNQVIQSGVSEEELYKLAAKKGMADSEISKLRNRLETLLSKPSIQNNVSGYDEQRHEYDTINKNLPVQKFKNDESIFGSELFTTNSLVFEPNLRIPAPVGYILGPDDELIISIYGYSEKKYHLTIDESGEIYIPNVGPIYLNGLSIEQATEKIKSKLASTIYRAINTGQTKVQVTLGKIRSIRVTVIGQAKKPGTFTVSSLTTLYNLLYLCGGPTSLGSYRNIELIRGNQLISTADLYQFLISGNQKNNIILQEGDVIRIPYYKKRVSITGNVKREGKFELLENETFSDLLKYCGGFTDDAYRGKVTVIRTTETEKKIIDLSFSDFSNFTTVSSDKYIVRKLQDEFGNRIFISGAVLRPGPYELTPGLTIDSLIEKSGGLTRDAYSARVVIFRYLANKVPSILSVDLDSIHEAGQNVVLQKDDSVAVHSIFEFMDSSYISVEGNVRKPGIIHWRQNITLNDALLSSGGISEYGDSATIEISRRIRKPDIEKPDHFESRIFNINLKNDNDPSNDVLLKPYDLVIVKSIPGYTPQRTILVLGEVKSPGRYSLMKSGDKISDIINRVGGFKASADTSSITIRRNVKSSLTTVEREKLFQRILNVSPDSLDLHPRLKDELYRSYDLISVDLGKAMSNPNSSEDLVLEDGDVLTINRKSNLVRIAGEVYNPTIIPYKENKSLKYYVQQAGNFTPYARKTGSLVIYPDGKSASVKHFLFFKFYPSVTPRSEIFVPQKVKSNRPKLGAGELALIVSALGIVANVIITSTK